MSVDRVDITNMPVAATTSRAVDGPSQATSQATAPERSLRPLLVTVDGIALFTPWFLAAALAYSHPAGLGLLYRATIVGTVAAATGLAVAAFAHLYRARVCAIRSVEVALLGRVAIVSCVAAAVIAPQLQLELSFARLVEAMLASYAVLVVARGIFSDWVRTTRAEGRYGRPVIMLGTNDEGLELMQLLATEPELGYQVVGVIGDPMDAALSWTVPWLGDVDDAVDAVASTGATGCVMAVSA